MNQSTSNISAQAFKQLRQDPIGNLRIIDLRTHIEVNTERLNGSAHFPVQQLQAGELKSYLQQQNHKSAHPIYLLCASGRRAVQASNQLQGQLESQLIIIDGGLDALKLLGVRVTKGKSTVISLERQVQIASGTLVVLGVFAGLLVQPWIYGLAGFVGVGLAFAGVTNSCGLGMLLAKMPWNRQIINR
jgi:rhodanese-related sulfurtransferase